MFGPDPRKLKSGHPDEALMPGCLCQRAGMESNPAEKREWKPMWSSERDPRGWDESGRLLQKEMR